MTSEKIHRKRCSGEALRCKKCKLVGPYCICDEVPTIDNTTFVTFICHNLELKRPSNTARIGDLFLKNSELLKFGLQGGFNWNLSTKDDRQPILLYPFGRDAREIRNDFPDKKIQLVVPDGNWPQASRIAKKALLNTKARPYSLNLEQSTRYQLRRDKTKADGFATLEAVAYMFESLGEHNTAKALHRLFDFYVNRHLQFKKQAPPIEKFTAF